MSLSAELSLAAKQPALMIQRVARYSKPVQTTWLVLLSLLLTGRYLWIYLHNPLGPGNDLPANGWFGWADQGAYFLAAHGWADGNFDPLRHVYPAGYALLGAVFVPFTPQQPFFVPNLLCWLASLWLFAGLGARLGQGVPGMRAISGLIFFLVTVADLHALYTWEIPWTSTPAATLAFASLLLAIRPEGHPVRPGGHLRSDMGAAMLASLIILFRPTDAVVLMPAVGSFLLFALWRRSPGWGEALRTLVLTGCAFATGPALLVATHVITHGWALGAYFEFSRSVGFEWRLLPLRWVTLMLSPRPLYPSGAGFAEVYWFVLPGLAGIVAAVLADQGRRAQHALVGGAAIVFACVYLCYRDLHVMGLFDFHNQHYFKWTLPVFALYALGLIYVLAIRQKIAAGVFAIAVVVLLSCWRPGLAVTPADPAPTVLADGHGITLPHGMAGLDGAILAAAPEDFLTLYFGKHTMVSGAASFLANSAFKVVPLPGGFMVLPLRPLPAAPTVLHLAEPERLDPAEPVIAARQEIVFGLPCSIAPQRAICRSPPVQIPPVQIGAQ